MRSKEKLLQSIADDFLEKTSQLLAPNITTDEAKQKLKDMDTDNLLANVEKTIIADLGLKATPEDLIFRQFSVVNNADGSQYLDFSLSFSSHIVPQVNAAVARSKAQFQTFNLSNYVAHIIQRFNPGMPAKGTVQLG